MTRRQWTRKEQLLALRLYCLLPFGKLDKSNKEIIAVAEAIGRTPSAVSMKACNFASLDQSTKQKGLGNASQSDRDLWELFMVNSEVISLDSETLHHQLVETKSSQFLEPKTYTPNGETESRQEVRVRRVQGFFRKSVLVSYNNQCAISGLEIPELIIASHIIPWSQNENRRADPTNGIALNALYDKAFDRGFIAFDDNYRVILSKQLVSNMCDNKITLELFSIEGQALTLPSRFHPDIAAIQYHRNNIFLDNK